MAMDQQQHIEHAMREAEASLNVEGMYSTEEDDQLIRQCLEGKISYDVFLEKALELSKKQVQRNREEST